MSNMFAITPERAQVINDYLRSEGENRMPAQGMIVFGKPGDESVLIRFDETADSYAEKIFTPATMTQPAYNECKVNNAGEKIEPACEFDNPATEDVPHSLDPTKVRILMAAINPSEILPQNRSLLSDYPSVIANLRAQLGMR